MKDELGSSISDFVKEGVKKLAHTQNYEFIFILSQHKVYYPVFSILEHSCCCHENDLKPVFVKFYIYIRWQ
jgi:hypothetical protein